MRSLHIAAIEALERRQLLSVTSASISPPSSAVAGAAVAVGLNGASDDDSIYQWNVNWGDNSSTDTVPGNPASDSHTFSTPGSYTVSATAFDDNSQLDA